MKNFWYRIRRYIYFLFQVIFVEKPKGLDFTMFDTSALERTNGRFHGYSKTNEKHLRKIFEILIEHQRAESMKILDVGCGKGVVLKEAAAYPFSKIGGIEIMPAIAETAYRNMRILELTDRVDIRCTDAVTFEEYDLYNVFFFFNPFSKDIFQEVLDRIAQTVSGKDIWIIYHHPLYSDLIEKTGMECIYKLFDSLKQYDTYIYKGRLKNA